MKGESQSVEAEMDGCARFEDTIGFSQCRRYIHVREGDLTDQALERFIAERQEFPRGLDEGSAGKGLSCYKQPFELQVHAHDFIGRKHTATTETCSHPATKIQDSHQGHRLPFRCSLRGLG